MKRTFEGVIAAAAAAAVLLGAGFTAARTAPKKDSPKSTDCSTCRETKPTLDPAELEDFDAESRPAYAAAKKYPETVDKIRCFCGCEESLNLRHKSLLTCFTSLHATGCEICRGETELAGKMKGEGSSDDEVKRVVESLYRK